ncbi:MAG: flavodoxin domain-containing protein [Puniceicoccales bacterium]|jgi:sulfite reductase (NADPH) flavoprotein alpha-component|nr:flavodoxin domain-containing protein [Puniceicoccales bacterium]
MSKDIIIYYASVTGNSESIAQRASQSITGAGWTPQLVNLADVKPADLSGDGKIALFVASTWGDGEPPTDAEDFFDALTNEAPGLSGLRFAVFGLGDSSYEQFNGFTKKLEARLTALGGKTFHTRGDADIDFERDYAKWEPGFLTSLRAL